MTASTGDVVIALHGTEELLARFERLSQDVQNRISLNVLRAGMRVLIAAGRDATPSAETPGHDNAAIRNSIRGRITRAAGKIVEAKIGFNVGKYTAPHAHLYALGTVERFTSGKSRKKRGRLSGKPAYRGRMPAHNYFGPAMDAAEGAAIDAMQAAFQREMESA